MERTYRLDEKGIPYRVGVFPGGHGKEKGMSHVVQIEENTTAAELLRHSGQLKGFQLYFFS